METPSVGGSAAGGETDPDEHIVGRETTLEAENRREIDPLQTHLENGNRTRFSETLHVPRVPFPSATSTGLRAENIPSTDDWFRRRPTSRERGAQAPSNLPPLRLEPFDGDCTRWSKFAAGFKALIHDVVPNDYQIFEYLRLYLSENVRAEESRSKWEKPRTVRTTKLDNTNGRRPKPYYPGLGVESTL